jgi:hypothetical protein
MCLAAGYRALHLGKVMNYVNKSTMQHIPYILLVKEMDRVEFEPTTSAYTF